MAMGERARAIRGLTPARVELPIRQLPPVARSALPRQKVPKGPPVLMAAARTAPRRTPPVRSGISGETTPAFITLTPPKGPTIGGLATVMLGASAAKSMMPPARTPPRSTPTHALNKPTPAAQVPAGRVA